MKKILILFMLTALIICVICVPAAGCGKTENTKAPEPDTADILKGMREQVSLPEMMDLIDSDLTDIYGIDSADVAMFSGCILGDGYSPDEIVLIKASSEDAAQRIRQSLDARLKSKINEAKSYNPDAYALMQKSRVSVRNVYVSMIVSPDQDRLTEIYDSYFN